MRSRRITAAAAVTALIGLLGACADDGDDDESPTETSADAGIANPASTYCVEQGGTVEIVTESDGQVGYCILPDGTRVEEWEYYREQTGNTQP